MNPLFSYLWQVIIISGILYSYYYLALRNKRFHHYNRFYLLTAFILSIVIPFLNITVHVSGEQTSSSLILQTLTNFQTSSGDEQFSPVVAAPASKIVVDWQDLVTPGYILVASIVFFRILLSLYRIRRIIRNNPAEKLEALYFVNTHEPGTPFSFFRWLFWNKEIELDSEKGQQMFRHEIFHIRQQHSIDILFTEIVTMICWINPFFYLMKKELQTIHEFLADRYAIQKYPDWKYAELLLMQALGTRQQLVNPFFHNQIKRRIAMITTSKKPRYQYLRKLMVLPIAAMAFILFAFHYKKNTGTRSFPNRPFTVVIDAGHGGTDNGAIAANGIKEKDLVLSIAKKIRALNEDDQIKIFLTRESDVLPTLNERTDLSKRQKADLFISLHLDAFEGNKGSQLEVLIPENKNPWFSENKIFASILIGYLGQLQPAKGSISEVNKVWVLKNSSCPSVLIECGNLNNADGLKFVSDPSNHEKIAQSILMSIDQYLQQQKNADWGERKATVGDTSRPVITFSKNSSTGKLEGTYNGEKFKQVIFYKPVGNIGLMMPEGKLIVLSLDQSEELKNKYGTLLMNNAEIIEEKTPTSPDNKIFVKVEIDPAFPGGSEKWAGYLKRNLDVDVPVKNKAPKGEYSVIVQFVVNLDGTIKDIRALTKHGYGMEEEAIRVIKNSPKWIPALQNGRQVAAYLKIPIHFFPTKNSTVTTDPINEPGDQAKTTEPGPGPASLPEIKLQELRNSTPYSLLKLDEGMKIASFTFTIDDENGKVTEAENNGNEFSEVTKQLIANATTGRMITIDRIKIIIMEKVNDQTTEKVKKMPGKVYKIVN